MIPPPAAREMNAPHARPALPAGTRVDGLAIWLLVAAPWLLASTVFAFDIGTVLDALWIGDADALLEHLGLHLGVLLGSSLTSIALCLLLAGLDARRLRRLGLVRPFPWGFAALSGIVYVIGRHVVLRRVVATRGAPLWVSIALYVLWYSGFAVWAAITVTAGLARLG